MVLIQVLLPTTFPNGAASQEASAALADTRRELAETCLWVDRLCPLARQGRLDRTRRPCGTRRCRDGGGRSVQKLDRGPSDAKPWAVAALIPCGHGSALASAPVLLVALAGWINQQQRDVIDYLREENHVLREQLGPRRLRFTNDQRIRLAAKAKTLGRRALTERPPPVRFQ